MEHDRELIRFIVNAGMKEERNAPARYAYNTLATFARPEQGALFEQVFLQTVGLALAHETGRITQDRVDEAIWTAIGAASRVCSGRILQSFIEECDWDRDSLKNDLL